MFINHSVILENQSKWPPLCPTFPPTSSGRLSVSCNLVTPSSERKTGRRHHGVSPPLQAFCSPFSSRWRCTGNQNAYLVNRNDAGGLQLSRDPLNLVNKHSRKVSHIISVVGSVVGGIWLTHGAVRWFRQQQGTHFPAVTEAPNPHNENDAAATIMDWSIEEYID